ncbi:MAG TPA: response regulator [Candidatus Omnitrophota bacterium]|nr:response regulator [Candidatus Omnitrophota bacterium]
MKKILIVDDEKPIREMLKKFLSKKGYEVFEADNGEDAIKIVEVQYPAAVLLDIRMPKTDGVEVLRKIRQIGKDIGVVMISAVSETALAEKCMELGAFDYITKPISLEYLEECLLAKMLDFYT